MRIARVIGSLTLNAQHETFHGATLKVVVPLMRGELEQQVGDAAAEGAIAWQAEETLVAWDGVSVSEGALVAIAEGPEASMPFRPQIKPVDAQIVALLDHIELTH